MMIIILRLRHTSLEILRLRQSLEILRSSLEILRSSLEIQGKSRAGSPSES